MTIFEKIKRLFNSKENANNNSSNDLVEMVNLYEKLSEKKFSVQQNNNMHLVKENNNKFIIRTQTTTIFQNDTLIVGQYIKKQDYNSGQILHDAECYKILTKDINGKLTRKVIWITTEKTDGSKIILIDDGNSIRKYTVENAFNNPEISYIISQINEFVRTKISYGKTQHFFKQMIDGVEKGDLAIQIQAKCVCVDARLAANDEIGKRFCVYSHGKIEKEIIVQRDTVFITTLDRNGEPIVDESGHRNIYDMPVDKFRKKYRKLKNGHYVQNAVPVATIKLGDDIIPEDGIKLLPPCWGGYEGTLMRNGIIILPFNSELTIKQQLNEWKKYFSGEIIDWYPNNEPDTYAICDKRGIFKDQSLNSQSDKN